MNWDPNHIDLMSRLQLDGIRMLRFSGDDGLRKIAATLRRQKEPLCPGFRELLARLLDPESPREELLGEVKLVVSRAQGHRPQSYNDPTEHWEVGIFLYDHIELRKVKHEAAIREAMSKFGCSRRTCNRELKRYREKDPNSLAVTRAILEAARQYEAEDQMDTLPESST